ncbi:phage tail length tape measure family protein [Mesorhizobium sp. M0437]|uniref:phage tail length tape measure family protein n=1 Tax=Mesorhizobium sp. M0437 TaxID=2956945 RepID=UPI00333D1F9F
MSLNLALIISGDASGAKAAAEETSAAVRTIGVTATNAANAQAAANDEAVAAASRVTQVLTGQDAVLRARGAAAAASLTSVAGAARLTSSQLLNLSRQGNDVVTMFALGVPAMQIFASQAGQVYDALESGPKGLGGSLTAIRSSLASTAASFLGFVPGVGLVTTGLVAAGAAAIAYALLTRTNIQSVDDVLKTHKKIIDEIAAAYPLAAAAAKAYEDQATKVPLSVAQADAIKQAEDEKNTLAATLNNIRRQMSIATTNSPTDPAGADFAKLGQAGVVAFRQLAAEMQAGQIDAAGVQKRLGELRIDPGLSKVAHDFAEQLQDSANQAAAIELHLRGSSAAIATFQGVTVGRGDEGANLTKWLAGNRAALVQLQRDRETAFRSLYARSPEEQARAARATEDARPFDPNEGKGVRDYRADTAAALAYARAQQTLDEAQKQRLRSLDQTIAAQQLDIGLIGKTAAEAASLRMAFQLEQAVREEAARNNVPADEAEIRRIRQKAAEYGRLSAIQSARTTIVGQGQTIETQRAELALVGASTAAHDRVIASLQVEQQIRQLGIALYGTEAEAMRANAAELAALAEARWAAPKAAGRRRAARQRGPATVPPGGWGPA